MTPYMALVVAAMLACLTGPVEGFSPPALPSFQSLSRFAAAAAGRANAMPHLFLGEPCTRRARLSSAMSAGAAAPPAPSINPFTGKRALIFTWYPAKQARPAGARMLCISQKKICGWWSPLAQEMQRDF